MVQKEFKPLVFILVSFEGNFSRLWVGHKASSLPGEQKGSLGWMYLFARVTHRWTGK
jgi:hypothetical protein